MTEEENGWMNDLHCTPAGLPKPIFVNAMLALEWHPDFSDVLAFDTFLNASMVMSPTPWDAVTGFTPRKWTASDDLRALEWIQGLGIYVGSVVEPVEAVAHKRSFDSLEKYLNDLVWDGKPRIDTWLTDFLGVIDSPYTRAVASKWLLGAVARGLKPGVKFDYVLILEGAQGLRKSTALNTLGGAFFTDNVRDVAGKDGLMALAGKWIVELSELHAFNKKEASVLKDFFARQQDEFRAPYARRVSEHPRRCVFAGTVNPSGGYLDDPTGARRFWPVECHPVVDNRYLDVDGLSAARDQLFAEAVVRFKAGETLYLGEEVEEEAKEEQGGRQAEHPWTDTIVRWADGKRETTTSEVLADALMIDIAKTKKADAMAVAAILTSRGWCRRRRRSPGRVQWVYVNPEAAMLETLQTQNIERLAAQR